MPNCNSLRIKASAKWLNVIKYVLHLQPLGLMKASALKRWQNKLHYFHFHFLIILTSLVLLVLFKHTFPLQYTLLWSCTRRTTQNLCIVTSRCLVKRDTKGSSSSKCLHTSTLSERYICIWYLLSFHVFPANAALKSFIVNATLYAQDASFAKCALDTIVCCVHLDV